MVNLRNEYPRPQLVRKYWQCLNGKWGFYIDNGRSGLDRRYERNGSFPLEINVPYCPESELSGVHNTDFMNAVWYKKTFEIPKEWSNKRIILHFGAVDFFSVVYVNNVRVGEHAGGYTPFSFDITDQIKEGENILVVYVEDDTRSGIQASGKQSEKYNSYNCYYTRTTGIWQTVWLEPVENSYVKNVNYISDITVPSVKVMVKLCGEYIGKKLSLKTSYEGRETGSTEIMCNGNTVSAEIKLKEKQLWEAGKGRLYDVTITLADEKKVYDEVSSYFGLREVGLNGMAFTLNGKNIFGRWVLDQGFYPDGIYTAPSDEALKNDILYSMQLGFNGARLHEKVFEPRFLYWADVLGYTVWGEYPNWGLDHNNASAMYNVIPEWLEAMERDIAHPSLIGWCPFNETWGCKQNKIVKTVYFITKSVDPTRPVIDTSGNYHTITDIFDVHDYDQNPETFKANYLELDKGIAKDQIFRKEGVGAQQYTVGKPFFMSEYGGIRWTDKDGWGYGVGPKTEEEFFYRYKGLTEAMLFNDKVLGFCYTQLYDVEQEQNGLMTYDRKFKFAPERIYEINTQKAAIEEKNEE